MIQKIKEQIYSNFDFIKRNLSEEFSIFFGLNGSKVTNFQYGVSRSHIFFEFAFDGGSNTPIKVMLDLKNEFVAYRIKAIDTMLETKKSMSINWKSKESLTNKHIPLLKRLDVYGDKTDIYTYQGSYRLELDEDVVQNGVLTDKDFEELVTFFNKNLIGSTK